MSSIFVEVMLQNEFNSIGDNNNLSIGFLIKEFMASSDVMLMQTIN